VAARALATKVLKQELPREFPLRDIYRPQWTALTTREEATKAADVLVDLHWLREVKEDTGGRPSLKFVVNPRVWEKPHEMA
jgi:hypothetical protein